MSRKAFDIVHSESQSMTLTWCGITFVNDEAGAREHDRSNCPRCDIARQRFEGKTVESPEPEESRTYYLSFCDGDKPKGQQFLGESKAKAPNRQYFDFSDMDA